MPAADTHISTSIVVGTMGYLDPEYHEKGKLNEKCDTYSFGVILGVFEFGKEPTDKFFQEDTDGMSLV